MRTRAWQPAMPADGRAHTRAACPAPVGDGAAVAPVVATVRVPAEVSNAAVTADNTRMRMDDLLS